MGPSKLGAQPGLELQRRLASSDIVPFSPFPHTSLDTYSRSRLTLVSEKMSRHRLIGVLAVVLCLPAATIAWLGFRLIEQDRDLESQRATEGREQAANRAVQRLTGLLYDPGLLAKKPGDGALLVHVPGSPLLFRQAVPPLIEATVESF